MNTSKVTRITAIAAAALLSQPAMLPLALAKDTVIAPRAATKAPHQRVLPLEGGRNFRDLGGYPAAGGRHVKWGLLFRSGSMHGLTPRDYAYLGRLGIQVVCDLRDVRERANEPVNWPAGAAPRVLSDDYTLDMAQFLPKGSPKDWTADQARAVMTASYPRMLDTFNGQYRRMFAELLAGHAPLAFNCSAGKDRTGIAAALLLTALGVPRAVVIQDYLLTNTYLDGGKLLAQSAQAGPASPLAGLPPAVAQAMMQADPAYIGAALRVLDTHPGGAQGWLRDQMGLTAADIARLRRMYLS